MCVDTGHYALALVFKLLGHKLISLSLQLLDLGWVEVTSIHPPFLARPQLQPDVGQVPVEFAGWRHGFALAKGGNAHVFDILNGCEYANVALNVAP